MARPTPSPPPPVLLHSGDGHRVVWRHWRLVPDRLAGSDRPLLTGLLGFPWRTATMQARCTERRHGGTWSPAAWWGEQAERHHPAVPAPGCSCGIYARVEPWHRPGRMLAGRKHPTVAGFVALSGRSIVDGTVIRAERARIVGPLALVLPRRSLLRRSLSPQRVITEPDRYRLIYVSSRLGEPLAAWATRVTAELEKRYDVEVRYARRPL